ncbi:MAG: ArsA-related P-loop ATPase [Actinomycetes bacterium]
MTAGSLDGVVASKEILIVCGSGGVGKTSIAAAIALGAASRVGGKVLVVTIDPAKRLASALGLEEIGNSESRVPDSAFTEAGLTPRGELWVAMLDMKESWDSLVLRHAPDAETAQKILDNSLYDNITSRFVQSHDYIAMERLFEIHATGTYDLIVIDTPPTRNALDFLEAPHRMAEFFGGRLLRWLTAPYRAGGGRGARLVNFASKPFYQVADRILGTQFLQDIAEFFLNFQSMYDGFVSRAQVVERLLHDRRTTFLVVTTLESAPLREAEIFCGELTKREFPCGALITNKTLPASFTTSAGAEAGAALIANSHRLAQVLAETGVEALADSAIDERVLRTVGESFRNFSVVAAREAELRVELQTWVEGELVNVPSLDADVHDLGGLAEIADHLFT